MASTASSSSLDGGRMAKKSRDEQHEHVVQRLLNAEKLGVDRRVRGQYVGFVTSPSLSNP
jgi:hypothetical protein